MGQADLTSTDREKVSLHKTVSIYVHYFTLSLYHDPAAN